MLKYNIQFLVKMVKYGSRDGLYIYARIVYIYAGGAEVHCENFNRLTTRGFDKFLTLNF